jgi:hypothetical protein
MNSNLISDESLQITRPKKIIKYKIPAVCLMSEVAIRCLKLIDYIKGSGKVFY